MPSDRAQKTRLTGSAGVPMVDFSRQYASIRSEILEAIEKVCASQRFILGKEVAELETITAKYCGVSHAIGCASGTDALWLALTAAGIQTGDSVVTTPFSFFASVSSILRTGAQPVLADIEPKTFNLDPSIVDAALRAGPVGGKSAFRAVLPVHLYGQCADWDRFAALKAEFGVILIEDAAQAFGATWNGRRAGSLGDAAAFSFYPTKNLSAFGDAGLVTTENDRTAEQVRMLHVHGMRQRYVHEEVGWNCRLDTIQAAVLLVKLRYLERWNEQRRERANTYRDLFTRAGLAENATYPSRGVVLPHVDPRGSHVFHQFVIRTLQRDELKAYLAQYGIGSEIYYPLPLHLQPALRKLGYAEGSFPESERAAKEVLALPIFPELTHQEQELVVNAVADFLS